MNGKRCSDVLYGVNDVPESCQPGGGCIVPIRDCMTAAGQGRAASSGACGPSGFSSHLDEAAEPSDAQLAAARREYIARALDPWRETGVAAVEVERA